MWRLALALVPAVALSGSVLVVSVAAPLLLAGQRGPALRQPIAFEHLTHVRTVGMECAFCHRSASTGVSAGMPDLQQCMGCHIVVGQGVPEIEKVRQAWVDQQPLQWLRVHRLPDHTRFSHAAHAQAGVECTTCHGDVGNMRQVTQVRSLAMADCVACHRQTSASTECVTCHYRRRMPDLSRREFLHAVAASTLGAVAFAGCQPPAREGLTESRVLQAEDTLSANEAWYATTCRECSAGCGLIVRVVDGRAKKAGGNPLHPVNHGKLCARGQAVVQAEYHPDRLLGPHQRAGERGAARFTPIG